MNYAVNILFFVFYFIFLFIFYRKKKCFYLSQELVPAISKCNNEEELSSFLNTLVTFMNDEFLDKLKKWGESNKPIQYNVRTEKVTFFLSLHRFFGQVMKECFKLPFFDKTPLKERFKQDFFNKLFQNVLDIFAVLGQTDAGWWKRNLELNRIGINIFLFYFLFFIFYLFFIFLYFRIYLQ